MLSSYCTGMKTFFPTGFLVLLLSCTALITARSEFVVGNLGSDGSGSLSGSTTGLDGSWLAQGFNSGSSPFLILNSITVGMRVNPATNVTLRLYSDSGGLPGTLLTSSSSAVTNITTTYSFDFGAYSLAANTAYWAVLGGETGAVWAYATSGEPTEQNSSGYSYVGAAFTTNSGSSWVSDAFDREAAISVVASAPAAVPEPGTWAAAILLLGGAVFVCWRRRFQTV